MLGAETARDLALVAGLVWADDRDVLAPLVDAVTVWADDQLLEEIARPIVVRLWADDLRGDIERALRASGKATIEALADLELGPERSRLALAYALQGASDLCGTSVTHPCLCCLEEGLRSATGRNEEIVHGAAVELVLATPGDVEPEPRIRELAVLAEHSLPSLSAALLELDFEALQRDVVLARC